MTLNTMLTALLIDTTSNLCAEINGFTRPFSREEERLIRMSVSEENAAEMGVPWIGAAARVAKREALLNSIKTGHPLVTSWDDKLSQNSKIAGFDEMMKRTRDNRAKKAQDDPTEDDKEI